MKKVKFYETWEDTYNEAWSVNERTAVLLAQAYNRGHKQLIAGLLQDALFLQGEMIPLHTLLTRYGQAHSVKGLRETARLWGEDLGYDVTPRPAWSR